MGPGGRKRGLRSAVPETARAHRRYVSSYCFKAAWAVALLQTLARPTTAPRGRPRAGVQVEFKPGAASWAPGALLTKAGVLDVRVEK